MALGPVHGSVVPALLEGVIMKEWVVRHRSIERKCRKMMISWLKCFKTFFLSAKKRSKIGNYVHPWQAFALSNCDIEI